MEVNKDWPVLGLVERRLLGVLVEKAKTTPDAYPLSLNALVTGSNQKSNRDPLLNLSELDVEESLQALQQRGLTTCIQGGRVDRWKHNLYEAWMLSKVDLAILAELLLRGPQTEGELRGRASRMEPIPDLESLRLALRPLTERRLVVFLGPEGRRGTQITHGFHDPKELEQIRSREGRDAESTAAMESQGGHLPAPISSTKKPEDHDTLQAEIADLRTQLMALQQTVGDLTRQVQDLKNSLGA